MRVTIIIEGDDADQLADYLLDAEFADFWVTGQDMSDEDAESEDADGETAWGRALNPDRLVAVETYRRPDDDGDDADRDSIRR